MPSLWLQERELLFSKLPEYKAHTWDKFLREYDFLSIPDCVSLKPVINVASGLFTHAKFFSDKLAQEYNLPVGYSYLPLSLKQLSETNGKLTNGTSALNEIVSNARAQGRVIIVSTGVVHQVKRCDKVASVLLRNEELRSKVCYIIVGETYGDYCERLIALSKSELKCSLFLPGRVTDNEMVRIIDEADLCINLRFPNSEVCSLSLLEQMSRKKAVLVIRSGIYGEVPDNAVINLNLNSSDFPNHELNFNSNDRVADYYNIKGELDEIERLLLCLIRGELNITEIEENACKFTQEHATKEAYAKSISKYIDGFASECELRSLQKKFLTSVAERSEALFGDLNEMPDYMENIVKSIDRLFNDYSTVDSATNAQTE
jgi:glycosyltransferase involved in cell wall biosynthesis